MRFAVIYSVLDEAGKTIVKQFQQLAFSPQIPIIELKKETITADIFKKDFPQLRNSDFLIFASKHKSEKGLPSLSIHAPGNWRSASYGGKEGKVCLSSACVFKYLFQQLDKEMKKDAIVTKKYALTMEATHHGPSTDVPCLFVELGSTEKDWSDERAGLVLAKTILSLEHFQSDPSWIPTIAIGGPHYAPNFTQIQLKSNYAISHIIPSYTLPLTEKILHEAEEKTAEQVKEIFLDWKGCGNAEERNKNTEIIKKLGFKYTKTG
ncbi:MAG: hypothetical protein RL557_1072 [archaeon]|jgi:D-aminoacyl-tRNA deacylase